MSELSNRIKEVFTANGWNWDSGRNAWKKNRTVKTHEEIYAEVLAPMPEFEDNTRKEMIVAVAEASVADVAGELVDLEAMREANERWQENYRMLSQRGWSEADDRCWSDMYYTTDETGNKLIVARVSPESKEIRIIGRTESEILDSLIGLYTDADKSVHRHQYIDDLLKDSIIRLCDIQAPGATTDVNAINGTILPASVANILYRPAPCIEEKVHYGWKLSFNNTSYYPTVATYIKHSMSAFLARPEKFIKSELIVDASNSKDVFTYNYLDTSKFTEGPTSEFDTWGAYTFTTSRQYHTFCAWIGSIFDAEGNSKQMCYMHGNGNMGTSKIQMAIAKVLGKYGVTSFSGPESLVGQFVNSSVVGKRLALITDVKNPDIARKGIVHNWTGGDNIQVNQKHKQSYTIAKYLKVWDCENQPLTINFEEDNQMSRVLYFRLKTRTKADKVALGIMDEQGNELGDNTFQQKLDAQVYHWIYKCIGLYNKLCPNRSQITPYPGHTELLINNCADMKSLVMYNWLLDTYEKCEKSTVTYNEVLDDFCSDNSDFNKFDKNTSPKLTQMIEKYFEASVVSEDRLKMVTGIKRKHEKSSISNIQTVAPRKTADMVEAIKAEAPKKLEMIADIPVDEQWLHEV